jgi:hypothetical protein
MNLLIPWDMGPFWGTEIKAEFDDLFFMDKFKIMFDWQSRTILLVSRCPSINKPSMKHTAGSKLFKWALQNSGTKEHSDDSVCHLNANICWKYWIVFGWGTMLKKEGFRVRFQISLDLSNLSSSTMVLRSTQASNRNEHHEPSLGANSDRCAKLTTSSFSMSPCSRECAMFVISQPYWSPRHVTGIA